MHSSEAAVADEIDRRIRALPRRTTQPIRAVRRAYSDRLRDAAADEVLAVADALVEAHRWVAYELVSHHPDARDQLDVAWVMRLGRGLDGWVAVDTFARHIAGPAWQRRQLPDDVVRTWAASPDRWWRRAALVSTVPLNLRAAGGVGDSARTLDICRRLVHDRDDMVVKALSWALRALVVWDPAAVRAFLAAHRGVLAARVAREVTTKLETGRKDRRRPTTQRG